jgi:hypothetical protein
MELEEKVLEIVREEAKKIKFGSITINISEEGDFVDVVSENRRRVSKTRRQLPDNFDIGKKRVFLIKAQRQDSIDNI